MMIWEKVRFAAVGTLAVIGLTAQALSQHAADGRVLAAGQHRHPCNQAKNRTRSRRAIAAGSGTSPAGPSSRSLVFPPFRPVPIPGGVPTGHRFIRRPVIQSSREFREPTWCRS